VFTKVPTQVSFVELEHEMLALWERDGTFEKLRRQNAGKPPWSFLDGPITANDEMKVHHAWGRTYKDCYQRFHAMRGHELRYQNGFDCQGLWVEVEVEKELGFRTKRDIEEYGLARFVERCKERVRRFSAIQTEQSVRLGYWMDWDDSYYTMSEENNYTIWRFLKECHERGLIYRGRDSMPWCARCGTGISQHEMHEGYREVTDVSVVVRLPLRGREGEHLLVWTTTPWTLTSNVACAVHPDLTYARARQDGEVYYLAESRLEEMKSRGDCELLGTMPGAELVGWAYDGPFDELPAAAPAVEAHRVIEWNLVSGEEGTGIVHIAPGCGKEDYDLSRLLGLPVIAPIDESGVFLDGFGPFTGMSAFEVAEPVFESLREKGYYYKKEPYTHSYPHCWRCKEPLLFRNVAEWYIDMSWRREIMDVARRIRWIPDWGLDRELDWLMNMRDWMISKKRYWGLALPIWRCGECGWFDVIGGREELKERAVEGWDEFDGHSPHRPWIDAVKVACGECGRPVARIADVGNPWLDAGIVPYSTVRYNTDRAYWEKWIPADFVTECFPGQFRNWFYSLLAMSTMMEGIEPFRTLLGHALVQDEEGREMHKSWGNAIEFNEAADRMGCDVMRWVFCRQNPVNNLRFGWHIGDETRRKVFNTLWNVYAFFCNYARLDGFEPTAEPVPVEERQDIDRWLLSDLQLLVQVANDSLADFEVASLVRRAERFIDDLSNWYVRRNRRRFWRARGQEDRDKLAAYQTLHEALVTLCGVLAPVIPFLTEAMYRNLVAEQDPDAPQSVHLCDYPEPDEGLLDEELSADMGMVIDAVSAVLSMRNAAGVRVRQPLPRVVVVAGERARRALERFEAHLLDEVNVKGLEFRDDLGELEQFRVAPRMDRLGPRLRGDAGQAAEALGRMDPAEVARAVEAAEAVSVGLDGRHVEVQPSEVDVERVMPEGVLSAETDAGTVLLDTEITPELRAEGLARDTVRHVQQYRKELDLNIEDRIHLRWRADSEELRAAVERWRDYVMGETLALRMEPGLEEGPSKSVQIGGAELTVQIAKA
jgi:isoleucyl-tRNA synthetase